MAYDIKELTKEIHQNAERQEFVKTLMSGTIRPELYAIYLYNQLQCYSVLEKYGNANDLFRQTPGLQRAENIHKDYAKLWPDLSNPPKITDSTKRYVEHIETIQDDPEKLYSHIYVRHFGDMYGGQMISKAIPSPQNIDWMGKNPDANTWSTMYDFQNKKELITAIRENLSDGMADEAKTCFQFAINLFKELEEYYDVSEVDIS